MTNWRAFDLSGRVAIVTGGGRGIGLAICRCLAGAGARVVVAENNPDSAQAAIRELESLGAEALFVSTDVRITASVDAMVDRVCSALGGIDVLVNNAGIAKSTPAQETTDDEWREMFEVNVTGVFRCCRSVGRRMLERGRGAIVNVASMSGSIVNKPQPQVAYNASKAAVIQLTKSLAVEWAARGVRVNSVSPGYIETDMTRWGLETPELRRIWTESTPMGRVGQTDEIALAVLYLASDASAFATGTDLIVDGGYTCW
jgi:NAD(P)-dependent dehydrogenase (short-subunit alcohol dehydrogenase family)